MTHRIKATGEATIPYSFNELVLMLSECTYDNKYGDGGW